MSNTNQEYFNYSIKNIIDIIYQIQTNISKLPKILFIDIKYHWKIKFVIKVDHSLQITSILASV